MELWRNIDEEHLNNTCNSKIILAESTLIRCDPSTITKSIKSFDNIINAIQQVCIPQFSSDDQAQFWKKTVSLLSLKIFNQINILTFIIAGDK